MVGAKEAQDWAQDKFKGIIGSAYLPFTDNDGIDEEALRKEVRTLLTKWEFDGLWYCGTAAIWSLTMDERKKVGEIVFDEAKKVKPSSIVVAFTSAESPKDVVSLTKHAQDMGADIVVIENPVHHYGIDGILEFYKYIADRTDIAISMMDHGPMYTTEIISKLVKDIPAICAIKIRTFGLHDFDREITKLTKHKLTVYEIDEMAHLQGMAYRGEIGKVLHGSTEAMCSQKPPGLHFNKMIKKAWEGKLEEAAKIYHERHIGELLELMHYYDLHTWHGVPGFEGHYASLEKYWYNLLGMPLGSGGTYVRPPQSPAKKEHMDRIKSELKAAGLIQE